MLRCSLFRPLLFSFWRGLTLSPPSVRGSTAPDRDRPSCMLRFAAERITRELRFAGEVSLLEEGWDPGTASLETCSYIYYDDNSKSVMLLDASGTKALSAEVISGITFSADPAGGPILLFTIHGESSTADYSLESSVQPLNVGESGIGGAAASEALSFRMPAP